MKKLVSLLLTLLLTLSLFPVAYAAESEEEEAAQALYELGLFKGTGTNPDSTPIFDLDKTPTRNQAIIMLVRLLGKEEEALAGEWKIPFTDVTEAMRPYIGYAYTNGLTNGTSATTYSGTNPIKPNQYIAFVLRSLGYVSGEDFQVATSWKLANDIGLTNGEYDGATEFTRGDVAIISYNSLSCEEKVDPFRTIPAETERQKADYDMLMNRFGENMGFPDFAKGATLSWEQARALVGHDLETVKRYVKTVQDCMYYIVAAGYSQISGDLRYRDGDLEWHFNPSPQVVFDANEGNCGGTSGLVACLLEGDYDEVGMVAMRGAVGDGGHVANYVKDGDVYYVFDMNQFGGGYMRGIALHYGIDLNETVMRLFGVNRNHPNKIIYTYTGCYDGDAPMGWPMRPDSYIIEGYVENLNIVMETPKAGYVLKEIPVSEKVLEKIESIRNK